MLTRTKITKGIFKLALPLGTPALCYEVTIFHANGGLIFFLERLILVLKLNVLIFVFGNLILKLTVIVF